VLDVVDWFVVVEDGDNVSGKGEGLGVDDAVDDFFEGWGGGGLAGVCIGGHGKLEDDVLAFQGAVVVANSDVGGMAWLELEAVGTSSALFFKEGCNDAGGWLDTCGW
jgi:hypothetical protein